MTWHRFGRIATIAAMAATRATTPAPLPAQAPTVTQVQGANVQPSVQLAFGYECGDRFLLRNDGAEPVDLEYGIAGGSEHWKLHLKEREAVELSSPSSKALELWVNGKMVASAPKQKRACAASQPTPGVVVRPIGPPEYVTAVEPSYVYGYGPRAMYLDPWPYYYPGSYFSVGFPFFGGFGSYGRVVIRGPGRRGR